jgi:hypothetical protein
VPSLSLLREISAETGSDAENFPQEVELRHREIVGSVAALRRVCSDLDAHLSGSLRSSEETWKSKEVDHKPQTSSFAAASIFAEKLRRDETAGQKGPAMKK